MKKRRFPSLRRHDQEAEATGVSFEDLPLDEHGSEVVTHPSPGAKAADDDPDSTKPRPTMPASAVILHDATDAEPAPDPVVDVDDDYAFRPPADADADSSAADAADAGAYDPAVSVPDVVVDADVRDEVIDSLAVSTFVEGPPGSGISTLLVQRVVASLRAGKVGADSMAVLVRDGGRAAHVRDRLRDALEEAAGDEDDDVARRRLGIAVAQLRSTAIGPGSLVAEGILRRWPEAAHVAPGFVTVADHVARVEFEAAFARWLAGRGGEEPAVSRALSRGVTPGQIHDLAEAMTRHIWLLPRDVGGGRTDAALDTDALLAESSRRIADLAELAEHGTGSDDGVVQIRALQRWLADADGLTGDAFVGHFLANAPAKVRAAGSRANWDPADLCAQQMTFSRDLHAVWSSARRSFGRSTIDDLVEAIAGFVGDEYAQRASRGRLFTADLIPAALTLLASDAGVRRIERDRHSLVVVDDVWDVDAPALALALVLTSLTDDVEDPFALRPGPGRLVAGGAATTATMRARGADPRLVARMRDHGMTSLRLRTSFRQAPALLGWTAAACRELLGDDADVQVEALPVTPAPGRAVPDEADPSAGPEAEEVPAAGDDGVGSDDGPAEDGAAAVAADDPHSAVSTNELPLPSVREVLTPEGHLMPAPDAGDEEGDAGTAAAVEQAAPAEEASPAVPEPVPAPPPDPAEWGPVVAAWRGDVGTGADTSAVRAAEAAAVAAALRELVGSAVPCVGGSDAGARSARWSDCALVLGSTAGLEIYLDALETAGVPYTRRSSGTELLRRQEIRDLMAVLRAAADPADVIATLGALRGLGFGCSDTDLVTAVACNGAPLVPTANPAEGTPASVAEALEVLARLGEDANRSALEVVDLALELTRFRSAVDAARGADPASLDSLRALAVDWCGGAEGVGAFCDYVDAAQRPLSPPTVTGPAAPSTHDTVEVLTPAESAGREFPVVAAANLHRLRVPLPTAVADYSARRLHLRAGRPDRGLVTEGFDAALARDDEEFLAQRSRLVCSAFSRARDVLVVAVTATADDVDPDAEVPRRDLVRRVARLLVERDPDAPLGVRARPGVTLVPVQAVVAAPPPGDDDPSRAATAPRPEADIEHRTVSMLGATPDDPLRAALGLAFSRSDFDTAPVATAPVAPEAVAAACREVGAVGSEPEVVELLDRMMATDLWARADGAQRVLRRPSVFFDGGAAGAFTDRLDLALIEGGAVVGVLLSLSGTEGRLRTRAALGTHALAYATGLDVGAALVVDARNAQVVEIDAVGVDALVEEALGSGDGATGV